MDFFLILQGRGGSCAPFSLAYISGFWLIFPFPHLMRTYEEHNIVFYLLTVKNYVYPEFSFVLTIFSVMIKMV